MEGTKNEEMNLVKDILDAVNNLEEKVRASISKIDSKDAIILSVMIGMAYKSISLELKSLIMQDPGYIDFLKKKNEKGDAPQTLNNSEEV